MLANYRSMDFRLLCQTLSLTNRISLPNITERFTTCLVPTKAKSGKVEAIEHSTASLDETTELISTRVRSVLSECGAQAILGISYCGNSAIFSEAAGLRFHGALGGTSVTGVFATRAAAQVGSGLCCRPRHCTFFHQPFKECWAHTL